MVQEASFSHTMSRWPWRIRRGALARPGDLILTVGAGDIYRAGEKLLAGV